MNQVIIAYHAVADGEVKLSPELVDYQLYDLPDLRCWPAGTGYALADWLRTRGHEPQFMEWPSGRALPRIVASFKERPCRSTKNSTPAA